jgi:hypothetical protein
MDINHRTILHFESDQFPEIIHGDGVFTIGSCFSENISSRLSTLKFNCHSNPFGVSYNPVSIAKQLDRIAKQTLFEKSDLFKKEDLHNSFELHGSFFRSDEQSLLNEINETIHRSHVFLNKSKIAFVTLGTSWVYREKKTNTIVNNCHKFPSDHFYKELLSLDEIKKSIQDIHSSLKSINKDIQLVFTISPVRHLKDGFSENMRSKSLLKIAIEESLTEGILYFPSYEIVMDDLRDYRYYEKDLIHPNEIALDYIFETFSGIFFSENTNRLNKEIRAVVNASAHKAFNSESGAHQKFLKKTINTARKLQNENPIDFSLEIRELESQLLTSE